MEAPGYSRVRGQLEREKKVQEGGQWARGFSETQEIQDRAK